MKRFLGMTEEEVAENERLWREENDENLKSLPADAEGEMRGAGISGAGIAGDMAGMEDVAPDDTAPVDGADDTAGAELPSGGAGADAGEANADVTV